MFLTWIFMNVIIFCWNKAKQKILEFREHAQDVGCVCFTQDRGSGSCDIEQCEKLTFWDQIMS